MWRALFAEVHSIKMMLRAARLSYLVNVSCLCLALGFVVSELLSAPASNTANKHKHKHHRHFPHFPWDPKCATVLRSRPQASYRPEPYCSHNSGVVLQGWVSLR